MKAAKIETCDPAVDESTVMERIAEIVRMVAALTHEVCTCAEGGRLANADHVHQRLMLAHAQLARALAPPEEIDAEARRGLETLRSGHPDLHHVVASFLADIASYPGDATWNTNSHLPSHYLLPPEPTDVERKRIEHALKTAADERRPRSASWCSVDEDVNASAGGQP